MGNCCLLSFSHFRTDPSANNIGSLLCPVSVLGTLCLPLHPEPRLGLRFFPWMICFTHSTRLFSQFNTNFTSSFKTLHWFPFMNRLKEDFDLIWLLPAYPSCSFSLPLNLSSLNTQHHLGIIIIILFLPSVWSIFPLDFCMVASSPYFCLNSNTPSSGKLSLLFLSRSINELGVHDLIACIFSCCLKWYCLVTCLCLVSFPWI